MKKLKLSTIMYFFNSMNRNKLINDNYLKSLSYKLKCENGIEYYKYKLNDRKARIKYIETRITKEV